MWFNAIIRAKPYQSLKYLILSNVVLKINKIKFNTGVARLSSARVVRCLVHSFNERNSYFLKILYFLKTFLYFSIKL